MLACAEDPEVLKTEQVRRIATHDAVLRIAEAAEKIVVHPDGANKLSIRAGVLSQLDLEQGGEFSSVGFLAEGFHVFCTGSLIRPNVVLTAAHCLVGHKSRPPLIERTCGTKLTPGLYSQGLL
jgi:hypothetical protein